MALWQRASSSLWLALDCPGRIARGDNSPCNWAGRPQGQPGHRCRNRRPAAGRSRSLPLPQSVWSESFDGGPEWGRRSLLWSVSLCRNAGGRCVGACRTHSCETWRAAAGIVVICSSSCAGSRSNALVATAATGLFLSLPDTLSAAREKIVLTHVGKQLALARPHSQRSRRSISRSPSHSAWSPPVLRSVTTVLLASGWQYGASEVGQE